MTTKLERFRQHKDEYFADGANSPLELEDIEGFTGLDYFPENESLALLVNPEPDDAFGELVSLEHSDGSYADFRNAGTITFAVGSTEATLTLFKDLDRGRYFLPFIDATSGGETYSGGRYLDPQEKPDGMLIVDFNYAYNPYCAYGEGWSCPIPPAENRLTVPIEAGEKSFRS